MESERKSPRSTSVVEPAGARRGLPAARVGQTTGWMSEDRPTDETPETIATQEPPASDPVAPEPPEPVAAEAPVTANGTPPADEAPPATPEVTAPEPEVTAPASPTGPAPDAPDARIHEGLLPFAVRGLVAMLDDLLGLIGRQGQADRSHPVDLQTG